MARHYRSAESILVCLAVLALLTPAVNSQITVGPPANPFPDPKEDPYNPLRYIASNTLTTIAFGESWTLGAWPLLTGDVLVFVILIALVQTFYTVQYGAKWMLAMVIGGYSEYLYLAVV